MVKSRPVCACLFGTWLLVGSFSTNASAQFGGTQDIMLEKQRRQQQEITAQGNRAAQPFRPIQRNYQRPQYPANPGSPQNPGYPHRPGHYYRPPIIHNHHYHSFPGYLPYGYPSVGWPPFYHGGPIIYPPNITVVPPGVPLTSEILEGAYSVPLEFYSPFQGVSPLPVFPIEPFDQRLDPGFAARPPLRNNAAPNVMPGAVMGGGAAQAAQPVAQDEITRRVAALKPSTEAGRLRSDELIADGDREFAAQQFRKAAGKYREAIAKAPDYPPGHLRAGHAYIATGDYELAVTYFAMGFELSRNINRPGFSLADIYRGNALAQQQHEEALADAVLRQPDDGGLLFLTGLTLHYGGRPLQARDYFRRAAEMPGRHQPYAAMFVPQPAEAKQPAQQKQEAEPEPPARPKDELQLP